MIHIWYSTQKGMYAAQYEGDKYEIVEVRQELIGKNECSFKIKLRTDVGGIHDLNIYIEDIECDTCTLQFFIISSNESTFRTSLEHHKGKNTFEDFKDWVSEGISNIRNILAKKLEIETKKDELNKDFF